MSSERLLRTESVAKTLQEYIGLGAKFESPPRVFLELGTQAVNGGERCILLPGGKLSPQKSG